MMGSAALLCVVSLLEAAAGSYVMTDSNIYAARDAWLWPGFVAVTNAFLDREAG